MKSSRNRVDLQQIVARHFIEMNGSKDPNDHNALDLMS